ncbi:tetratricopeptide repeat-containing sensor histidine kinase [bacterium]|nr:tetratricopeptide repeat-containing sensor histidine kinase [bacterium]
MLHQNTKIFLQTIFIIILASTSHTGQLVQDIQSNQSSKTNSDLDQLSVLHKLAHNSRRTDVIQSRQYALDALKLATQMQNDSARGLALTELGHCYQHQGQYVNALDFFNQALNIARQTYDSTTITLILNNISFCWKEQGYYSKALDYMYQALRIREYCGDNIHIAYSYDNISGIHQVLGNMEKALFYTRTALKLRSEINDEKGIAYSYNKLGRIYAAMDSHKVALKYHREALKIRSKSGDDSQFAHSLLQTAISYTALNNFSMAKDALDNAKKIFKPNDNIKGLAHVSINYGRLFEAQNNISAAKKLYKDALTYSKAVDDKEILITSYYQMGKCLFNTGVKETPLNYFQIGLTLSKQINAIPNIARGHELIYLYYKRHQQHQQALKAYIQYQAEKDKIFTQEANAQIIEIETVYSLEQQKKEITLLRIEKNIQSLQINRDRLIRNFLILSIIAAAIIVFVIWHAYKHIKQSNEKLQEAYHQIAKQKNSLACIGDRQIQLLKKLKSTNAAKDRFFSIIAHDLKNPLQIQLSGSRLLSDNLERMDKNEIKSIALEMKSNTKLIFNLLENLLQWAQMQLGHIKNKPQTIDISKKTERWITFYHSNAEQKGINLKNNITHYSPVLFDNFMLDSIFNNLLSNAIKFTGQGGTVLLDCTSLPEHYEISITDSGVGIEPERLEKLFRIDENISTRGTDNEKGTGLGMILCKEFIELNGGSINVESRSGVGTKFILTLRRSAKPGSQKR